MYGTLCYAPRPQLLDEDGRLHPAVTASVTPDPYHGGQGRGAGGTLLFQAGSNNQHQLLLQQQQPGNPHFLKKTVEAQLKSYLPV